MGGFIYRIGSYDNTLGRPPSFFRSSELLSKGLRFASVYAVRQEDGVAIQETAQTAAGFKGIVWNQRLWIDLDTEEASEGARRILKEMGLNHVVYSTGNRGCHIGVLRNSNPSHTLPQQDKTWVSAHIPGADLSLYWHLHLIRLPGVLHEKTGKPKTLVYRQEGKTLELPRIQEQEVNVRASIAVTGSTRGSIFKSWGVMNNVTGEEKSRHAQLVKLVIALRNDTGVSAEEALWVALEVNRGFSEPKYDDEVKRIVDWAYNA